MDAGSSVLVLSVGQAGTPSWLSPVIAGGAVILAAAVTAVASAYVAKRKAAELRLSNSFDLAKQYLESARNYTETVYMPLAVSVHKIYSEFLAFKAADAENTSSAEAKFRDESQVFIDAVDNLFLRGAGAVLTLRLDETVTRLVSFLRESLASTSPKAVKSRDVPSMKTVRELGRGAMRLGFLAGASGSAPFWGLPDLMREFSATVTAAPVASGEFEQQFISYIEVVKSGIKEVTLGGYKNDGDN